MEHRHICLFTFSLGLFLWCMIKLNSCNKDNFGRQKQNHLLCSLLLKKEERKESNKKFPPLKTDKIYNIPCHSSLKREVTRLSVCKRTFCQWKCNLSTRNSKNSDENCLSKIYHEIEMWGLCHSVNHNSQEFLCLD